MRPWLKYTLGRLGLLLGVFLILLPVPGLDLIVKLLIAFVVSFVLSWFMLRNWRNEMANDLARSADRRKERKEHLRSALAGEDEPATGEQRDTRGDSEEPPR